MALAAAAGLRTALAPWIAWPAWLAGILPVLAGVLALQLLLGWGRPQLVPVLVVGTATLGLALLPMGASALLHLAAGLAVVLGTAAAAMSVRHHPALQLPAPTGTYIVGSSLLEPVVPGGPAIQIWHPAAKPAGVLMPYRAEAGKAASWHAPAAATAAWLDAPPASGGPFPVVIYLPGWGGNRQQNTALLQDIASHGYAVVAADPWNGGPADPTGAADLVAPLDLSSAPAFERTLDIGRRNAKRQARHAGMILDSLIAQVAAGHPIAAVADTRRAALLGYSFGGAGAAEAAATNSRFRTVVNLDGWVFTDAYDRGIRQPYLLLSSDAPPPSSEDLRATEPLRRHTAELTTWDLQGLCANLARNGGWFATVRGSSHEDFSDAPWTVPWPLSKGHDAERHRWHVIRETVVQFLDLHLSGRQMTTSAAPASPELVVEAWSPAGDVTSSNQCGASAAMRPGERHAIR